MLFVSLELPPAIHRHMYGLDQRARFRELRPHDHTAKDEELSLIDSRLLPERRKGRLA